MKRATPAIPVQLILGIGIALLLSILISTLPLPAHAAEPTTAVRVVKYASDETTVLNETTVTYGWMETNLPVYGDGDTHYFHQGPIFDSPPGPWDENETANLKDKGAVKGTDVRDLCDLVGGMSAGDEIKIRASDGFSKRFGYENVYNPPSGQGPIVLCWYMDGTYVPDYNDGMQIVFFADNHIFGNRDMHECMASEYRYNYSSDYPSANGLSVRYVSGVAVYSTIAPPELRSIEVSPASVTLDIGGEQQFAGTAYDQYGSKITGITLTWTSSSETVGMVDGAGFFTAIAAGGTVVTAESGGVTGTADVTVASPAATPMPTPTPSPTPTPVLTTISVSPARATLNACETQQFTAAAYDQDNREISGVDFAWTSGNETVGAVNHAGVFAAVSAGKTVVQAGSGGVAGVADVIVAGPEPVPTETPIAVLSTPTPAPAETSPAYETPTSVAPPPSATPPALKAMPESTGFGSPGSGGVLAIIGVLVVAYAVKRRGA
ncbi:MAG: Ig-like domain-containing protein [Euryarchaeota archaeon]|nr:Ig-like domain-containing protein [Euryarchaeota archaeon]